MARECPQNKFNDAIKLLEIDPEAGLERWRELARHYPSDVDVRLNYGIALLQTDHPFSAVQQLELATQRNADVNSLQALLRAYAEVGMPQHGIKVARRIRDRGGIDMVTDLEKMLSEEALSEKQRLEFERCHFEVQHEPSLGALNRMLAFAKKSGGFLPAYNNAVIAAIEIMDFKRAFEISDAALAIAPTNIHALFSRVRLEYVTNGLAAARVWLPEVQNAPVGDGTKIFESEATQAQTLALLNDEAGVEKVVLAYQKLVKQDKNKVSALFEMLIEKLELRKSQSDHPFYDLMVLLPKTILDRWTKLSEKSFLATVTADLKTMPGVLEFLRDYLLFENAQLVSVFAPVLVGNPSLPVPNDARSWFDIFKLALQNPNFDQGLKMKLAQLFQAKELMTPDEITELTGMSLLHLEIHQEQAVAPYTEDEFEDSVEALGLMREGLFSEARQILEPLVEKYPGHESGKFNLTLAYFHDSTVKNGKAKAETMLLELANDSPTYLFAKAELASLAMERNDLEAARGFLALPPGLKRVHSLEYASFTSALGRLAVHEGDIETAKAHLEVIADIEGEDSAAYINLEQAINPKSGFDLSRLLEKGKKMFYKS
jgi:tetratricopeptide (TPR) repeat protein